MIRYACPLCRDVLEQHGAILLCSRDGYRNEPVEGIHEFMTPSDRQAHAGFLDEYRAIRREEGRGADDAEYYLALPSTAASDPRHTEWNMRAAGMTWLHERLRHMRSPQPLVVLDAGAGNCWLTRRLCEWGHRAVALDVNDDTHDGLLAGHHYLDNLPISFDRVRADFARLPFVDGAFDVVVFNGAFHYAHDMRAVLAEAHRVTRDGGEIILLDSPVYSDFTSGMRMIEERRVKGRAGFLTFSGVRLMAEALGLGLAIETPSCSIAQRLKRKVTEFRIGREVAVMAKVIFTVPGKDRGQKTEDRERNADVLDSRGAS